MKNKLKFMSFVLSFLLVFMIAGNTVAYAQDLPNTTLLYRQRGEAVKQVQSALNKLGHNLTTDGIYGPATRGAVKSFQAKYTSLLNDGVYGPRTRQYLVNALDDSSGSGGSDSALPNAVLRYWEISNNVRKVQQALNRLGYSLIIDSVYGPATRNAVRGFQSDYSSLINDGIYGPNTRNVMVDALDGSSNDSSNGSSALPNTTLLYNQRGTAVKQVQVALTKLGYDLVTDGIYGTVTRSTIRSFQSDYSSLINDGVYGPKTRAIMVKALDGSIDNDTKPSGKTAYLTFDDGPSRNITPRILNTLNDYNIEATFFVLGNMAEKNPSILKRIQNEGHSIGNHTYSHDYDYVYASVNNFLGEVDQTDNILKNILGGSFNTSLLRFPGGSFESYKDPFKSAVRNKGYRIYDWNASNGDSTGTNLPVSTLMSNLKQSVSGEKELVILMHDSYYKDTTAQALPQVIEYLKNQGYSFSSLTE